MGFIDQHPLPCNHQIVICHGNVFEPFFFDFGLITIKIKVETTMSANTIGAILGEPRQAITRSGRWFVNTNVSATGDKTITPAQMTLDGNYLNANAQSMLSSNTSYFAFQFDIQGEYAITWNVRSTLNSPANTQSDVWTYLGVHTYNGSVMSALGTAPPLGARHAAQQGTWTNASGNSVTNVPQQTVTITQEYKVGDIVAPWFGCGLASGASFNIAGQSNASLTAITCSLLRRTA